MSGSLFTKKACCLYTVSNVKVHSVIIVEVSQFSGIIFQDIKDIPMGSNTIINNAILTLLRSVRLYA